MVFCIIRCAFSIGRCKLASPRVQLRMRLVLTNNSALHFADISRWLAMECTCQRPTRRTFTTSKLSAKKHGTRVLRLDIEALNRPEQADDVEANQRQHQSLPANELGNQPRGKLRKGHSKRIFSLIQPTGIPHLGNYLGALRPWKDLQDAKIKARRNDLLIFGLADLHSLTLRQSAEERRKNIRQTFASLLAIGLDPQWSKIFCQSHCSAHTELLWYLSTAASTGKLARMTQWKEKLGVTRDKQDLNESLEKLKLGLFTYPVLQAADILLYQPDIVPVGEDQAQHIEFARAVARSFNSMYATDTTKPLFLLPTAAISPAARIMNLQDPTKKMSKSEPDENSRVLITDDEETIRLKIRKAKTDSVEGPITYDRTNRPGVANLIDILRHTKRSTQNPEDTAAEYSEKTMGDLKTDVADCLVKEFEGIGSEFARIMRPDSDIMVKALQSGDQWANAYGHSKINTIKRSLGLVPSYREFASLADESSQKQETEEAKS